MKTVRGIYAEAKIFTDDVEEYAEAQVKMICGSQVAEGSKICLMPDIHEKEAYTQDVQTVQDYAELNRQIIVREILKGMKWKASAAQMQRHSAEAGGLLSISYTIGSIHRIMKKKSKILALMVTVILATLAVGCGTGMHNRI